MAAIVFQILKFKCLILSGVSVQSALDPVLAYLLQHTWFKMSSRTLGLPVREQQLRHGGNPVHTPLWGSPPLLVLGISKHLKGSDTHLFLWCSPSLLDHWGQFYVFWGVNFQVFFLIILHLNERFYFFQYITKGFLSCFSRYPILC